MRINCKIHASIVPNVEPSSSFKVDNYLINRANEEGSGYVRLYNWDKHYLTVPGRQKDSDINHKALKIDGVGLAKRSLGGGALLIGPNDFVMTVIIGNSVFPANIRGLRVYCIFNSILVNALGHFGVIAEKVGKTKTHPTHKLPSCFATADRGELVNEQGQKIYGGDFTGRVANGFLQYGFVSLSGANSLVDRYLNNSENVVPSATLREAGIEFEELAEVFIKLMYGEFPAWRP